MPVSLLSALRDKLWAWNRGAKFATLWIMAQFSALMPPPNPSGLNLLELGSLFKKTLLAAISKLMVVAGMARAAVLIIYVGRAVGSTLNQSAQWKMRCQWKERRKYKARHGGYISTKKLQSPTNIIIFYSPICIFVDNMQARCVIEILFFIISLWTMCTNYSLYKERE